jgi:tetratricopeptide (TPR) repeat protein
MNDWYPGSGMSYQHWLQHSSLVQDVVVSHEEAVRHIATTIERESASLILENATNADKTAEQLDAIRAELSELTATAQWGLESIHRGLEGLHDTLQSLLSASKTPAQTAAYEQFEIARDAFERGLFPETLDALTRAVQGDHTSPGYPLEYRFHEMMGVLRLGAPGSGQEWNSIVDPSKAESAFALAGRYARIVASREAARAFFYAARAAFVQEHFEECCKYVALATQLAKDLAEAHYLAARAYAAMNQPAEAMGCISRAADEKELYTIQAAADPCLLPYRRELNLLIAQRRTMRLNEVRSQITIKLDGIEDITQSAPALNQHPIVKRWRSILLPSINWGLIEIDTYRRIGCANDAADLAKSLKAYQRLLSVRDDISTSLDRWPALKTHSILSAWEGILVNSEGAVEVVDYCEHRLSNDLSALNHIFRQLDRTASEVETIDAFPTKLGAILQDTAVLRWRNIVNAGRQSSSGPINFDPNLEHELERVRAIGSLFDSVRQRIQAAGATIAEMPEGRSRDLIQHWHREMGGGSASVFAKLDADGLNALIQALNENDAQQRIIGALRQLRSIIPNSAILETNPIICRWKSMLNSTCPHQQLDAALASLTQDVTALRAEAEQLRKQRNMVLHTEPQTCVKTIEVEELVEFDEPYKEEESYTEVVTIPAGFFRKERQEIVVKTRIIQKMRKATAMRKIQKQQQYSYGESYAVWLNGLDERVVGLVATLPYPSYDDKEICVAPRSVSITKDGRFAVVALMKTNNSFETIGWDIKSRKIVVRKTAPEQTCAARISSDGCWALFLNAAGKVSILDVFGTTSTREIATNASATHFDVGLKRYPGIDISPDGQWLAAPRPGGACLYDLKQSCPPRILSGITSTDGKKGVKFSSNSQFLVGYCDPICVVWSCSDGRIVSQFEWKGDLSIRSWDDVVVTPDGRMIALGTRQAKNTHRR